MERSEQINELLAALSAFQGQVTGVRKDSENPHFRSGYASLEAVCAAANPTLAANGLSLSQWIDGDDLISMLGHKSGQWMSARYPIRPVKADPQGVGSAITYARRYASMAILGIAPEDDDGQAASKPAPGRPRNLRLEDRKPEPEPEPAEPPPAAANAGGAIDRKRVLAAITKLSGAYNTMMENGTAAVDLMAATVKKRAVNALSDDELILYGRALRSALEAA